MPDIVSANLVKETAAKKDAMQAALAVPSSTTAALAAVANAINTTNKFKNKLVVNDTTGILVVAAGPLAADVWKNAGTGATAHTPV
jgi:flagellar basal body P-ring protein FlgI